MFPLLGALVGAGASLIGGAMSSNATREAGDRNYEAQKEFAKNGLRWKIRDAKRAGIHPMYAVGAPTQAFAPSYVGDTSMGDGLAASGQDIGRAVAATQTSSERQYDATLQQLALDRAGLENELLRSQIARNAAAIGPAFPSANGAALSGNDLVSSQMGKNVVSNVLPDVTLNDQTPAQVITDEYGEWVGDGYGFMRYLDTLVPVLPANSPNRTYVPNRPRERTYTGGPSQPGPNIGPRVRY